jgi:hypothetical protein
MTLTLKCNNVSTPTPTHYSARATNPKIEDWILKLLNIYLND